jgi:hypothetical protein
VKGSQIRSGDPSVFSLGPRNHGSDSGARLLCGYFYFRHLILLEKYWRNGDLTLAPTATLKSASYLKSVKNR